VDLNYFEMSIDSQRRRTNFRRALKAGRIQKYVESSRGNDEVRNLEG
jgi:hypothetical protein